MDKPRSRDPAKDTSFGQNLIIESPHLQTLWQRFSNTILTFAFWVFWIYLFLPVISLLAWIFGLRTYYDEMVVGQGWSNMQNDLIVYSLIGIGISAIYIFWALYNYFRFVDKCRRTFQPEVEDNDLQQKFHINKTDLGLMRTSDIVVLKIDNNEAAIIEPHSRPTPPPSN